MKYDDVPLDVRLTLTPDVTIWITGIITDIEKRVEELEEMLWRSINRQIDGTELLQGTNPKEGQ